MVHVAESLEIAMVLGLLLAAAGLAAVRLRLVPAVGYLLVGVGVGFAWPHHPLGGEVLDGVLRLAVLLLLFLIGLELDLKRLRQSFRATAWVLPFHVLVPAAAIALLTRLAGWDFQHALVAGMALAISSTLFGDGISKTAGVTDTSRRRFLGQSIAEDVASAALLAVVAVLAGGDGGSGWLTPGIAVARTIFLMTLLAGAALLIVPRLLDHVARTHMQEVLLLWTIGVVALFGYLGLRSGSAELGAFLAGVAAAEAGSRYVIRISMSGVQSLALALFFLAGGLAVDLQAVIAVWPIVVGAAAVFVGAKVFVNVPASAASGQSLGDALRTALCLGSLGEFSLILATVAEREGLAHPSLRTVVVGAMVLTLIASNLLIRTVPAVERTYWRMPAPFRRTAEWAVNGLRRGGQAAAPETAQSRRRTTRLLASNLVLLLGWALVAVALAQRFLPAAEARVPVWGPMLFLGALIGLAVPMMIATYRAYRGFVISLVGGRAGERVGAGRVRVRLVDAWVVSTLFLGLVFLAVRIPQTLPVVIGAGLVALIVATVAWRRLAIFHRTLEGTLTRVLGEDAEAGRVLDRIMQQYPWGVRFAAVAVPADSPVAGHTVKESRIADLTGAMVAVLQRRNEEVVNPGPNERIRGGDTLVLLGDLHQIGRAEALVVAHGEALRLEAQSRSAQIAELPVLEPGPWVGARLSATRIRERTGVLVVGVQSQGAHPKPYEPDLELKAGDVLIVMGTPLQVERARKVAQGEDLAGEPGASA
jgi:monovalent cation:H+ antiporter-2, CPA2 family